MYKEAKIKTIEKNIKKEDKKNFGKLIFQMAMPILFIAAVTISISKQHHDVYQDKMAKALSVYYSDPMKAKAIEYERVLYSESVEEAKKLYNNMVDNKIINVEAINKNVSPQSFNYNNEVVVKDHNRIDYVKEMTINKYAKDIYQFKSSMFTRNESGLYFNNSNYDYFLSLVVANNTTVLDELGNKNIHKYNETVKNKTPQKGQYYIDEYMKKSIAVNYEISKNRQGLSPITYIITGSLYNVFNNKESEIDHNAKNPDVALASYRAYTYEMQKFLDELIKNNNELENYAVKSEEVKGYINEKVIPTKEEIEHFNNSLKN